MWKNILLIIAVVLAFAAVWLLIDMRSNDTRDQFVACKVENVQLTIQYGLCLRALKEATGQSTTLIEPGEPPSDPQPGGMITDPDPGGMITDPDPGGMITDPDPGGMITDPDPGGMITDPDPGGMITDPYPGGMITDPDPGGMITDPDDGKLVYKPSKEKFEQCAVRNAAFRAAVIACGEELSNLP